MTLMTSCTRTRRRPTTSPTSKTRTSCRSAAASRNRRRRFVTIARYRHQRHLRDRWKTSPAAAAAVAVLHWRGWNSRLRTISTDMDSGDRPTAADRTRWRRRTERPWSAARGRQSWPTCRPRSEHAQCECCLTYCTRKFTTRGRDWWQTIFEWTGCLGDSLNDSNYAIIMALLFVWRRGLRGDVDIDMRSSQLAIWTTAEV